MQSDLTESVVLITGAGSGIGRAASLLAAQNGVHGLLLGDIDSDSVEETADRARAQGVQVRTLAASIVDPHVPQQLVDLAVSEFGRLDCAFNNAGSRGEIASIVHTTDEAWDAVLEINVTSVFRCLRAQLAHMIPRKRGAIVNTASAVVHRAPASMSAYVASKTGLIGLTRVAALEAGPAGVRVNAVCPGRTDTPMLGAGDPAVAGALREGIPLGRFGRPEEVAAAALWLLSDAAGFVNGTSLTADGGRSAG